MSEIKIVPRKNCRDPLLNLHTIEEYLALEAPDYNLVGPDGELICPDCAGKMEKSEDCQSQMKCLTGCIPKKHVFKEIHDLLSSIRPDVFPNPTAAFHYLAAKYLGVCVASNVGTEERQSELLTAALTYASKGWRVIPCYEFITSTQVCSCHKGAKCKDTGKHPRVTEWDKKATADPVQIMAWWSSSWCHSNIGIVCGVESGIWCLDVDKEIGAQNLQALIAGNGPMPDTLVQITGSRNGHQYIFLWPDDGSIIPTVPNQLDMGLDLRGEGGFFIAPPSNHKSGGRYEWL